MNIERREMPRFPVNLTISKVNNRPLFGRIKDLSRRGMRALLDTDVFAEKSDIKLEIQRPDYNALIPVTACVVWKKSFAGKSEVGLEFKNIPVEDKVDLLDYSYAAWLKTLTNR